MPAEMTLRDHFAAAALTGLLSQGDDGSFSEESYVRAAYRWADAMLRCRAGGDCPGQDNAPNLDAAPAARANAESVAPLQTAGDRLGNPTSHSGTGETPVVDRPKPIGIAERLRDWADHYDNVHATTNKRTGMSIVMHEAADQIELLQSKLRLQDAVIRSGDTMLLMCSEKAAIQFMLRHAAHAADEPAFHDLADYRLHSEALYGLMERTAKWVAKQPRNGAVVGPDSDSRVWETPCTPPPQTTSSECSSRNEGT